MDADVTMKAALVAATATFTLAGCAVPLSADVAEQHNTCSSTPTAPTARASTRAAERSAQRPTVGLTGLKLVVTPVAGSTSVSTAPTVLDPANHVILAKVDGGGAYNEQFDATLPALVQVKFATVYPCDGQTSTKVPSKMALTSVASVPGLPTSTFLTTPDPTDPSLQIAAIPAGIYSAYVAPEAQGACKTAPPPTIFEVCLQDVCPEKHSVRPSKVTTLDLSGDLPLSGTITSMFSLTNWTLDRIDLDGAQVLSDELVLKPLGGVLATQVSFDSLHFNWPNQEKQPTIRLTPPPGSSAPVMYWDLASALRPSQNHYDVKLTLGDFRNESQTTQVFVLDNQGKTPQPGALVTFQSIEINDLACPGSVTRTLHADALRAGDRGSSPGGRYTVRATPREQRAPRSRSARPRSRSPRSTRRSRAGIRSFFRKKADLVGSISTVDGTGLAGVPVDVVPSQIAQQFDLVSLTTNDAWSARPFATTTDDSGHFSLKVDIGAPIDVSVRPVDGSGYPWLVQPQFLLQKSGEVDRR